MSVKPTTAQCGSASSNAANPARGSPCVGYGLSRVRRRRYAGTLRKRGRVLDIGTGPGWLLREIHTLNYALQLYGLDISRGRSSTRTCSSISSVSRPANRASTCLYSELSSRLRILNDCPG
jgi:SAM-dependent methyltransferase